MVKETRQKGGLGVILTEKPHSHLPDSYDKLIPVWQLKLDPYNVREEQPEEDLVASIRKTGFLNPVIVRAGEGDKFLVTDGWQRVQAGIDAGRTEIPCKICGSALEALKEAKRSSIQRQWTKWEKIKHVRFFYTACQEEGMRRDEAVQETVKNNPASEATVLKYLRITSLPRVIQALLKSPKERDQDEWNELVKYRYNIKVLRMPLGLGVADELAKELSNQFSAKKLTEIAIELLRFDQKKAIRVIRRIAARPKEDPLKIIETERLRGISPKRILHIGNLVVTSNLREEALKHCYNRRIHLRDLVKELLEEWIFLFDKTTPPVMTDEEGGKIRMFSFKYGQRRIKVFQFQKLPVIVIEDTDGAPLFFFSQKEVQEKHWNECRLPANLKRFLNNIKISLR